MQTLDLDSLPIVGAAEVEVGAQGLVPHRLPGFARVQTSEPAMALIESMPAGVRLRFRTSATELELDVDLTLVQVMDKPPVPAVFDVVVDGAPTAAVSTVDGTRLVIRGPADFDVVPGGTTTVRLPLPGDPEAVVEVWLPHAATVAVRAARTTAGASFEAAAPAGRRWTHYGSSISHCLEAARPVETWPNAVALRAGLDIRNLGFGGQCMLDQFVARTIRDAEADVISLKVGINIVNADSFRERTFVPALHGFLDTVREGHPDTPLLLVTPIFCPSAEDRPGPTLPQPDGTYATVERPVELATGALTLQRVRELIGEVVATRSDDALRLLDGLELFGPADEAGLYDKLHPDAAGYLTMADRFHDRVFADGGLLSR